ncbi:MAG: hypothetical protein LBR70_05215 [Lactobacillaceae bacterium]|jgi:hypothetical protein|nr:hypothetical protein [Lactobacillaceae bacterium]
MRAEDFIYENIKSVYVVFVDETSLWWLRFLKKGFRHCYIIIEIDNGMTWVEINPMSNKMFINFYKFVCSYDYIGLLKSKLDAIIYKAEVNDVGVKTAPLALFTCVEAAKRMLGIHDRFIITPYQLYKKIKVVGKKS